MRQGATCVAHTNSTRESGALFCTSRTSTHLLSKSKVGSYFHKIVQFGFSRFEANQFSRLACSLNLQIVGYDNSRIQRHPNGTMRVALAILVAFLLPVAVTAYAQIAPPAPRFRDCPDCPEMVVVPAGEFLMGSTEEETKRVLAAMPSEAGSYPLLTLFGQNTNQVAARRLPTEYPQRKVTITKPFALGLYPVTQGEFAAFVRETSYRTGPCWLWGARRVGTTASDAWASPNFEQTDPDPVVCVTWQDAMAYVRWLNRKAGLAGPDGNHGPYRLPSEAEWEYAARAGTHTAYWWGDDVGVGHALCNRCNDNGPGHVQLPSANHFPVVPRGTLSVGSFPPNPFGLYAVLGDIEQWTDDCWVANHDGAPADGTARQTGDCSQHVVKGGSWHSRSWTIRSAFRNASTKQATNAIGFRLEKALD